MITGPSEWNNLPETLAVGEMALGKLIPMGQCMLDAQANDGWIDSSHQLSLSTCLL